MSYFNLNNNYVAWVLLFLFRWSIIKNRHAINLSNGSQLLKCWPDTRTLGSYFKAYSLCYLKILIWISTNFNIHKYPLCSLHSVSIVLTAWPLLFIYIFTNFLPQPFLCYLTAFHTSHSFILIFHYVFSIYWLYFNIAVILLWYLNENEWLFNIFICLVII